MILAQKLFDLVRKFPLRHRIAAALIAVPCFGVVAAFGIAPHTIVERVPVNTVVEELTLPPLAPASDGVPAFTREERIQRGDTVASLLARLQVDDAAAAKFLRDNKQAKALRQLVPGKTVRAVTSAEGNPLKRLMMLGPPRISVVTRAARGTISPLRDLT